MVNRYWGSRFPVGNLFWSRFIFVGVHWRLATQRLKNGLKRRLHFIRVNLVNDASTAEAFRRFSGQGYDKLNIGGGRKSLCGFVNIDFVVYPEVERQIVANIHDLSFIPSNCVSHIHTNHTLEHLTKQQLQQQIKEYYRILKNGGLLSIRCPNALGVSYGFWFGLELEQEREKFVKFGFPVDEDFGNPADKWVEKDFYGLLHWFYGDVGSIENQHLSRLTPTSLRQLVESTGFEITLMSAPEAANIVLVALKRKGLGNINTMTNAWPA